MKKLGGKLVLPEKQHHQPDHLAWVIRVSLLVTQWGIGT